MVAVLLAAVAGAAPVAHADDPQGRTYQTEPLEIGYDPLLSQDARITDAQETGVPPGPEGSGMTCQWNTPLTTVNPQPTQNSFVLMYVLPSDVTANNGLDVPRYCSDGTPAYSALAKSSRNMASWLAAQSQGINFRVQNHTYTNWYTGASFSTRAVYRYRTALTKAQWATYPLYVSSTGATPRLTELKRRMQADGWKVPYSKYVALMEMPGQASAAGSVMGTAEMGGWYGLVSRYYPNNVVTRYGCGTDGDKFLAHESTHEVEAPTMGGNGHTNDYPNDLMASVMTSATFTSSPRTIWDYGADDYDATVRASAYVVKSNLTGAYFTC